MHTEALAAFRDNYIWLIRPDANDPRTLVVDPGDAAPVIGALERGGLELRGILVTHHHSDHVGGIRELLQWWQTKHPADGPPVWGPAAEAIPARTQAMRQGDVFSPTGWPLRFEVLEVPGHTLGHIAYVATALQGEEPSSLFCGDTLFSAGCGRLFEGTPAQMHHSLNKLSQLPENTTVNCAHEYTLSNLQFARAADPLNEAVVAHQKRCLALRAKGLPTLPSHIGLEKQINPFLRTDQPGVLQALEQHRGQKPGDAVQALAWLREWKNDFKG
ncbi:hydroxyacylglutathione hydrolase [Thiomonas arsenitoxydans]|jgi:hydroxyacylglutathione hydrolase|uniref:hydroxyacylglutathione hydrolase n=1 Tax=Thiomonas arsenitoxydans (strain DSM 22701 / CIP 110005 / 3As) TaxID=426114 RepID=UPI001AC5DAFD|nr:hydroxyacylglutathione hydrolase [Thiomonas arsenitoxydans]MBN8775868.1 hydroxyacylglutathione hydrolase [Thiomonas arsenitoxydans]